MDTNNFSFDIDSVIEQTGLDMDEYLEIYELYQESFQELMHDLESGLAANKEEGVMHAAHTLKGASANIGFTNIADLARQIQDDPGNFKRVAETIPSLWAVYEELNQQVLAIAHAQQ